MQALSLSIRPGTALQYPCEGFPHSHCSPSTAAERRRVCWERLCLSKTHPLRCAMPCAAAAGQMCMRLGPCCSRGGVVQMCSSRAGVHFSEPAAIRAPRPGTLNTTCRRHCLTHHHPSLLPSSHSAPLDPRPLSQPPSPDLHPRPAFACSFPRSLAAAKCQSLAGDAGGAVCRAIGHGDTRPAIVGPAGRYRAMSTACFPSSPSRAY
jgi:hypothetical protein